MTLVQKDMKPNNFDNVSQRQQAKYGFSSTPLQENKLETKVSFT